MSRSILDKVKDMLRSDDDVMLSEIIERGKYKIDKLMGTPVDYETDLAAQGLLLNRCRYDYNNATEYFEDNFKKEILSLQLEYAVSLNVGDPDEI